MTDQQLQGFNPLDTFSTATDKVLGGFSRNFGEMERKARGTKTKSRSCPGTLGSAAAGPRGVGWFPGLQLPESLVGDRANSFDRHGQSFGTKITRFSGHGEEGSRDQSPESELPWDSRFSRHGSPGARVVPRGSTAWGMATSLVKMPLRHLNQGPCHHLSGYSLLWGVRVAGLRTSELIFGTRINRRPGAWGSGGP